jgi:hypothetical protein
MLNMRLLEPRNFLVIALIVVTWHAMLSPIFKNLSDGG